MERTWMVGMRGRPRLSCQSGQVAFARERTRGYARKCPRLLSHRKRLAIDADDKVPQPVGWVRDGNYPDGPPGSAVRQQKFFKARWSDANSRSRRYALLPPSQPRSEGPTSTMMETGRRATIFVAAARLGCSRASHVHENGQQPAGAHPTLVRPREEPGLAAPMNRLTRGPVPRTHHRAPGDGPRD